MLGPADAGKPISRQEFYALDWERGWRFERARGRLDVMPPPRAPHRRTGRTFRHYLMLYYAARQDLVADVDQERWVETHGGDRQQGLRRRPAKLSAEGHVRRSLGPAEDSGRRLRIRFPGPEARRRDYVDKRAEYHAVGVREYVIVDPGRRLVTVLRWEADGYAEAAVLGPRDISTSPLLPGLSIPLAEAIGDAAPPDAD